MNEEEEKRVIDWECPVCMNSLTDTKARIVPCIFSGCKPISHPICQECMIKMWNENNRFKCPTCSEPYGTITFLNFFLEGEHGHNVYIPKKHLYNQSLGLDYINTVVHTIPFILRFLWFAIWLFVTVRILLPIVELICYLLLPSVIEDMAVVFVMFCYVIAPMWRQRPRFAGLPEN